VVLFVGCSGRLEDAEDVEEEEEDAEDEVGGVTELELGRAGCKLELEGGRGEIAAVVFLPDGVN
jgi:hypothetical protein